MKNNRSKSLIFVAILCCAFLIYILQILIFKKPQDTFFYLLQDLAFLPIQVLLVSIIITEWLREKEKKALLNRMNMVVGAYFCEVGNQLMKKFSACHSGINRMNDEFHGNDAWDTSFIDRLLADIGSMNWEIDIQQGDIEDLKAFLISKQSFIVGLLQNANLLEHERFTDLLWAVTHLTEELNFRKNLNSLGQLDSAHLNTDLKRAYQLSLQEWVHYMGHLKRDYPYIFSLYQRMNPFDCQARVEFD
jgi:hypothetical protein